MNCTVILAWSSHCRIETSAYAQGGNTEGFNREEAKIRLPFLEGHSDVDMEDDGRRRGPLRRPLPWRERDWECIGDDGGGERQKEGYFSRNENIPRT